MTAQRRRSPAGTASAIIAGMTTVLLVALVTMAVVVDISRPRAAHEADAWWMLVLAMSILGTLILDGLTLVLGLIGVMQRDTRRGVAFVGLGLTGLNVAIFVSGLLALIAATR